MLYFPQYPGAEDKIRSIYREWGQTDELDLQEVDFPSDIFNIMNSGGFKCLLCSDWVEQDWVYHPEIVAINFTDCYEYGDEGTYRYDIYHPKWGHLELYRESDEPDQYFSIDYKLKHSQLVVESFGMFLMQGEAAFALIESFEFSGIAERSKFTPKQIEDTLKNVLEEAIQNSRDLDLHDHLVLITLLRKICFCIKILYIGIGDTSPLPKVIWEYVRGFISYFPQLCSGFTVQLANTITSTDKWFYCTEALSLCENILKSFMQAYKLFANK